MLRMVMKVAVASDGVVDTVMFSLRPRVADAQPGSVGAASTASAALRVMNSLKPEESSLKSGVVTRRG